MYERSKVCENWKIKMRMIEIRNVIFYLRERSEWFQASLYRDCTFLFNMGIAAMSTAVMLVGFTVADGGCLALI